MPGSGKLRLATASLAGCFGCHMSFLDIDERILELVDVVEFDRTPLTDIKTIGECDVGLIGACAVNGGIPAMRNQFELEDCLKEAYVDGIGVANPGIPNDPEIPLLLNKVHPIHEVVKVDYFLPGCPPSGDTIWTFLNELIEGRPVSFPYTQIHYD